MLDRIAKALFALGAAFFLILAGIVVGRQELPPTPQIDAGLEAVQDWRKYWRSYLGIEPAKFLRRARYPGSGVVIHRPGEVQPGVTLMSGLWDAEVGLTLRAMDGKELHRWRARFSEIWPETPHLRPEDVPFNDWDTQIHGAFLYPDGDVVFNFESRGLVRLDRCGRVVWRLPRRTHHTVSADQHGDLWVLGVKTRHEAETDRFPGLEPPFLEDSVLQVSAEDGRVLREISLLDVIYGSADEGMLLINPDGQQPRLTSEDPLHANHVEVLPSAMAGAFPLFEAGDLLVSMRNVNLVAVVDPKTEKVRWAKTGPWVWQHEPHFLPDGRIAVFDNRLVDNPEHVAKGKPRRASRLVAVDPGSGRVSVLYEGTLERPFFTDVMGKHQYLPNGNVLVTEATAGRAFEITPDGRTVWAFVNRFDTERTAWISQATRYPASYATFAAAACPQPAAASGRTEPGQEPSPDWASSAW